MNLTFRVNQQTITKDSTDEVPRIGSREYLYLVFTFSKDWSNLNKTLYISDGTYTDAINITELISVQVPSYYTQNASFTITLIGTHENTVVPTNVVTCILEQSNEVWEEVAPNPDSITYQQLIEALSKIESIDDAVLVAQRYAEDSANSAKQAEEAINNAKADCVKPTNWGNKFGNITVAWPNTSEDERPTIAATEYTFSDMNPSAGDNYTVPTVSKVNALISDGFRSASNVDYSYNPESNKPQTGLAVSEAVSGKADLIYANNAFANALKGAASGKSITMTDVSPIAHKMAVEVSGVENLTAVKVKTCGKNLIDFFNISAQQSITFTNSDGSPGTKTGYLLNGLSPGEKYTISFSFNNNSNICTFLYLYDIDENWILQPIGYTNYLTTTQVESNPKTFTAAEGHHYLITRGASYAITSAEIDKFSTFQVEHGDNKTKYEAYITPTEYSVNDDGTVDNVESIYPNMTIYTETDGATIGCQYNRDINKAFEELQQAIISLGGNI